MPGFDGTGPRGMGPMTGGGRGFCAAPPGSYGYRGRGYAGVYGRPHAAMPTLTELDLLRNEYAMLKQELEALEARLQSMGAESEK